MRLILAAIMATAIVAGHPSISGADSGDPVIAQGQDTDRVSGSLYTWEIRANGVTTIIAMLDNGYAEFVLTTKGSLFSTFPRSIWSYDAKSDVCKSSTGQVGVGIKCIHPVVSDFISKHEFKPEHPLFSRIPK